MPAPKKRRTKRSRPVEETTDQDAAGVARRSLAPERRLESLLRAQSSRSLDALIKRLGIRIDSRKRIDEIAQIARALVRLPDSRELNRLPVPSAHLLKHLVRENGSLLVSVRPSGLDHLQARGMVFVRDLASEMELILPTALLLQVPTWEGEDPCGLRSLLVASSLETATAIASHYMGRASVPPVALALEMAWEALFNTASLGAALEKLSHVERQLLEQIESEGGEVDGNELMDLERAPLRLRGGYGTKAGRRGGAFALEKRGMLFPVHPNRYIIPTEVAALVGKGRREAGKERQDRIKASVVDDDVLPRRASFAADTGPLAVALAVAVAQGDARVKPGFGTPRSLISKLATRFGRPPGQVAMLAALSRAAGIWQGEQDRSGAGGLRLGVVHQLLFKTWLSGGAWDESRDESEVARLAKARGDVSPVGRVRDVVLDALTDLDDGQWVPLTALIEYVAEDPRNGALQRLYRRWAQRHRLATPDVAVVTAKLVLGSLVSLGIIDLGGEAAAEGTIDLTSHAAADGLAVRLSSRGRTVVAGGAAAAPAPSESHWDVETSTLVLGPEVAIGPVVALAPFMEITTVEPFLALRLESRGIADALANDISAEDMASRLAAVAELPGAMSAKLTSADTVVAQGSLVPTGGFLWVDPEVRTLLLESSATKNQVLVESPPAGLLLKPGISVDDFVRLARRVGVVVAVDGVDPTALAGPTGKPKRKSRTKSKVPTRSGTIKKKVSWRPVPSGTAAATGTKSRKKR